MVCLCQGSGAIVQRVEAVGTWHVYAKVVER